MLLWAKFNLYKYVTCWLIAVRSHFHLRMRRHFHIKFFRWFLAVLQEGVCILSGLGYNGAVEGKHRWDACANMKVWLFETTPRFQGTIDSFNINTNEWAARSVPH